MTLFGTMFRLRGYIQTFLGNVFRLILPRLTSIQEKNLSYFFIYGVYGKALNIQFKRRNFYDKSFIQLKFFLKIILNLCKLKQNKLVAVLVLLHESNFGL